MKQFLRLMIDSSIFIESLKQNLKAKEILEELLKNRNKALFYVNPFVVNEVVFISLIYLSSLSPRTLKRKKELVSEIVKKEIKPKILSFIDKFFILLEFNQSQDELTYELVEKYGLLPTDATILATCKYYEIKYLVSIDSDFPEPCEKEGITLLDSAEKLKEVLKKR